MKLIISILFVSFSITQSFAQKFVFSGSFGLANAGIGNSIFNRVGDPKWELTSEMFDNDMTSFPYAVGVDAAFVYKKITVSSGVRYIGTNHIARFRQFDDPSIWIGPTLSRANYFMSNIEIPLLFTYPIWEPKYVSVSGSIGASFNFNSVRMQSKAGRVAIRDSSLVGIGVSMSENQEPFFSLGSIVGISIRPRTFLKSLSIGCYYNAQWQGGADAAVSTTTINGATNKRYDYAVSYTIRPSYLVFYIKYDLFDFSLRE